MVIPHCKIYTCETNIEHGQWKQDVRKGNNDKEHDAIMHAPWAVSMKHLKTHMKTTLAIAIE